jgi:hypothetical protein
MNEKLLKLIIEAVSSKDTETLETPFEIGKNYYVRTFTYHSLGKLKAITGAFMVLEDGGWVADSGRFNEFLSGTPPKEFEKCDEDIIIPLNSIADAHLFKSKLPTKTI